MKTYITLCSVDRDARTFPAGSRISLPDDTAQRLLTCELPAIRELTPEEAGEAGELEKTGKPAQRLNAADTIAAVKAADTIAAVFALQEQEVAHEMPRKTVLDAIEARLDELAGDDEDDSAGDGDA